MDEPTVAAKSDDARGLWKQAHELACAGHSDAALPIYMRAIDAAKEAEHWADVANIMHDAGNAAADVGQFESAKSLYAISLVFAERAELPAIETLGTRIEKARVELLCGRPEIVYSDVVALVRDARCCWEEATQSTESTELFRQKAKHHLAAALDLKRQQASLFHQWHDCWECLDEMVNLVDENSEEKSFIRLAQLNLPLDQGRSGEKRKLVFNDADALLDPREFAAEFLETFQKLESSVGEARTWQALARIEMQARNDSLAIEHFMRAFSLMPTIVAPWDYAILHDAVATSWRRLHRLDKAGEHWLAALVIRLATGISWEISIKTLQQHRQSAFREVQRPFKPCSITDLLEKTAFLPLGPFLQSLDVSIDVLQERVNRILRSNPDDPDPVPPRRPPNSGAPPAAAALLAEFPLGKRELKTG